jgi:DtxR family transcriptional regulator, iron-dependent repressor
MQHAVDLVDTTEMYLRTIFELEEEGAVPLRARIAERLGHSVPTVSQTVARMERDELLIVEDDRRLALTPQGRAVAVRVMRKHRLAECLLVEVIGLDWDLVHDEACRWEHVMSEAVERRLLDVLGHPTESPYGNPIPGLAELGESTGGSNAKQPSGDGLVALCNIPADATGVIVERIGEPIQRDAELMKRLRRAGVRPHLRVPVARGEGHVVVGTGGDAADLDDVAAANIFVVVPSPAVLDA